MTPLTIFSVVISLGPEENIDYPSSVCGTNSQNTHFLVRDELFAKSQNYRGLKFLLSDTKSMNTCSFAIHFKKINVFSKVLVE